MTAQEYLGQAYELESQIESKKMQRDRLKALIEKKDTVLSNAVVERSRDNHRFDKTIAAMMDLNDEIKADENRLYDLKTEITQVIGKIGGLEYQKILYMRYLDYMAWNDIGNQLHYSKGVLLKKHREALGKLRLPTESAE